MKLCVVGNVDVFGYSDAQTCTTDRTSPAKPTSKDREISQKIQSVENASKTARIRRRSRAVISRGKASLKRILTAVAGRDNDSCFCGYD